MERIGNLLLYLYFLLFYNAKNAIPDLNRVPLYLYIVDLNIGFFAWTLLYNFQVNKVCLSNHIVQCYDLVYTESDSILIRFQMFKEPDLILFSY
ncbi:hypothetical protein BVG16_00460 [Paenibacillus selenitireducens]|uniref:Uncharacterized protein n=1 Tax=Paenibacillus selenitireducens TaxID=1324314 RepID=A0A1T2XLW6_9BACL|nr:hypothetical protein BVG16_00460 [Paenibacillus selenitireducens]